MRVGDLIERAVVAAEAPERLEARDDSVPWLGKGKTPSGRGN